MNEEDVKLTINPGCKGHFPVSIPKSYPLSPIFNTYYNNNKCKLQLEQWTMKAYTRKYETFFRSRYNEH